MATITLTEKRLIKNWTATAHGGDWYELNKTLHEIAQAFCAAALDPGMEPHAAGLIDRADDFEFCAAIALQRAVDEIAERKSIKVAVAA